MIPGTIGSMAGLGTSSPYFLNQITDAGLTDNLQLLVDIADSRSYPGTGGTIFDLSGKSNHLINGDGSGNTLTFEGTANSGTVSTRMAQTADNQGMRLSTNPSWIANGHKDGAYFTMAGWILVSQLPPGNGYGQNEDNRVILTNYGLAQDTTRGLSIHTSGGSISFLTDNTGRMGKSGMSYASPLFFLCAVDDTNGSGLLQINDNQTVFAPGTFNLTTTSAASDYIQFGMNRYENYTLGIGSKHFGYFGYSVPLNNVQALRLYNATKSRFS